ncbi:hypothetical protein LINPERPRIM_LOCUS18514 [Linum perenne]
MTMPWFWWTSKASRSGKECMVRCRMSSGRRSMSRSLLWLSILPEKALIVPGLLEFE